MNFITMFSALASVFICNVSVAQNNRQQMIKVMSYNILHGAAPGLKYSANNVDLEEVAKVIRSEDPDIVAIQEVDSVWSRSNNLFEPKLLAKKKV